MYIRCHRGCYAATAAALPQSPSSYPSGCSCANKSLIQAATTAAASCVELMTAANVKLPRLPNFNGWMRHWHYVDCRCLPPHPPPGRS
jgi:hypothetical protein